MCESFFSTFAHVVLFPIGCANSTSIPFTEFAVKLKFEQSARLRKWFSNNSPRGDYTANCLLSSLVC